MENKIGRYDLELVLWTVRIYDFTPAMVK